MDQEQPQSTAELDVVDDSIWETIDFDWGFLDNDFIPPVDIPDGFILPNGTHEGPFPDRNALPRQAGSPPLADEAAQHDSSSSSQGLVILTPGDSTPSDAISHLTSWDLPEINQGLPEDIVAPLLLSRPASSATNNNRTYDTPSETNERDTEYASAGYPADSVTNKEEHLRNLSSSLVAQPVVSNNIVTMPTGATGRAIQPAPRDTNESSRSSRDSSISANSANLGPLSVRPILKPRLKRSTMNENSRLKVKRVRQAGSCIRCRMYNESCDENTPCARCMTVSGTAKIFKQPCCREKLDDIIAFRAGNSRAGKVRTENVKFRWSSQDCDVKVVELCYPFKDPSAQSELTISVKCRKFIPQAWDILDEPFPTQTGEVMVLRSEPYACYDVDDTINSVGEYISQHRLSLLKEAIEGVSDKIHHLTHLEAIRYSRKYQDSAVSTALNIKAGCFFSRQNMTIRGTNTLLVPDFDDSPFHVNGQCPIPPTLDFQIDFMAIQYMLQQMKLTVKRLKILIFGKAKCRDWFEAYLTIFVLLSCLEIAQERQADIIAKWNAKVSNTTSQVLHTSTRMMQEWSYSAKVLIYHYRAILRGMVPFSMDMDTKAISELSRTANLDTDSETYITLLREIVKERGPELRKDSMTDLDNNEGAHFAWISQLYVDDA